MSPVIRVVADSVCDIPRELAETLEITLIPAVVNIGDRTYLDDGIELTREQFYAMMPDLDALPTTAACPLGLCREMIAKQARQADHVILISAPAHLSAIYNNFRIAAEEFAPGRYTLIDSGQLTMGAGFQVLAAAEMARDGHSISEITARLDDIRPRVHVFGALNTLENLYKSGRVGWAAALAGRLLQIKPLVELTEGNVRSRDNVRTFKRAFRRLEALAHDYAPFEQLAILHTNNLAGAQQLQAALAELFPMNQMVVVNVNPPLGTHVGAQALGLAMVTAK
ncbi:MAG: DegV family protein [Anaerolineae bacterium]|nr:DegV family protein [Anaerolineae bacterium]